MQIRADLDSSKITVSFPYSADAVEAIKGVPGARWQPSKKHWALAADLVSARRLREAFGSNLALSHELHKWGREAVIKERQLLDLKVADSPSLSVLPDKLPELYEWLRPYQRQDIAFMSRQNCINANQPGLGKTVETIGAIVEAGLSDGVHLVVAPATSLRLVWEAEIKRWLPDASVYVWSGQLTKKEREVLRMDLNSKVHSDGLWIVTTPNMLRAGSLPMGKGPAIWDSFTVDEYHKSGLSNGQSELNKVVRKIKSKRRYALSGTPMGGQPIRLWGALNFLDQKQFSSKWQWVDQWLEVESNGFGKVINGVRPARKEEFKKHLSTRMVRRTKADVVNELPPKQYISVTCDMSKKQARQYEQFASQCQVMIDDQKVSAVGVLAELTRLKQFANAYCKINGAGEIVPTEECPKLDYLFDRLEERGILEPNGEVAIVASESRKMIEMVEKWLAKKGVKTALITGQTKQDYRQEIVRKFQSNAADSAKVICLTTTAGGVAITLDRADSVHILDETWNPDDQEQLEDRAHRISRMHQVTIYNYRTKQTIQERIEEIGERKKSLNFSTLKIL